MLWKKNVQTWRYLSSFADLYTFKARHTNRISTWSCSELFQDWGNKPNFQHLLVANATRNELQYCPNHQWRIIMYAAAVTTCACCRHVLCRHAVLVSNCAGRMQCRRHTCSPVVSLWNGTLGTQQFRGPADLWNQACSQGCWTQLRIGQAWLHMRWLWSRTSTYTTAAVCVYT